MTELDMKWIVPFQKYYNEEYLDMGWSIKPKEFFKYQKDFNLGILFEPEAGREYYFGIDTYEGGRDHNAGVILRDDNRIAAYFKTQRQDIFKLVKDLCDYYGTRFCVERNRGYWL
jgi:hypothetical protein